MLSTRSHQRLQAIGIQVWTRRGRAARAVAAAQVQPRIRLEAGTGAWLLIVEDAHDHSHQLLLDDIRASIGPAECRFGRWSDSPDAGVGADQWVDHGIEHVLVLGQAGVEHPQVINGGSLAELSESSAARKRLWQRMKQVMED